MIFRKKTTQLSHGWEELAISRERHFSLLFHSSLFLLFFVFLSFFCNFVVLHVRPLLSSERSEESQTKAGQCGERFFVANALQNDKEVKEKRTLSGAFLFLEQVTRVAPLAARPARQLSIAAFAIGFTVV